VTYSTPIAYSPPESGRFIRASSSPRAPARTALPADRSWSLRCSADNDMVVNTVFSSVSPHCGIAVFNQHLRDSLLPLRVTTLDTNLQHGSHAVAAEATILHYVPSAFSSPHASSRLIELLTSQGPFRRFIVILHGLYRPNERRLMEDSPCPDQELHLRLILQTADVLIALSHSVANVCRAWQSDYSGRARLDIIPHPGLFASPSLAAPSFPPFAFVGGVSRTKKRYDDEALTYIVDRCSEGGALLWAHWTNLPAYAARLPAWRQTTGLLGDSQWSDLISNARVLLCPYQSRAQSVSGLMSEALSVGTPVLATSFDFAREMKTQNPDLVFIDNDLRRWPLLISTLLERRRPRPASIPTWRSFAISISARLRCQ
jgi:hypothetical protein